MNQRSKIILLFVLVFILIASVFTLCSCDFLFGGDKAKLSVAYDDTHTVYESDSLDSIKPYLTVIYTDEKGDSKTVTDYSLSGTLQNGTSNIKVSYSGVIYTLTINVLKSEEKLEYSLNSDGQSYSVKKVLDTSLTGIEIPSNYNGKLVTTIDICAFNNCTELRSITIGNCIDKLTSTLFRSCPKLESVNISANNPYYYSSGNCIVEKSSNTLIFGCNTDIIPDTVSSIGEYAFFGRDITNITIPNSVFMIKEGAFGSCVKLENVIMGNSVINIEQDAFAYCESLNGILMPDSVRNIGELAFGNCPNLITVKIGSGVNRINSIYFWGSENIKNLIVSSGNENYYSKDNCIIEKDSGELVMGCKSSVIPTDGSVKSIGAYAFRECTGLTSIVIPSSITDISFMAFYRCSNLATIRFEGTVAKWNAITKGSAWNDGIIATSVTCSNGTVAL